MNTTDASGPFISLVIPAYNEAGRLPAFLRDVRSYFDAVFPNAYEVIVVDDGSDDDTLEFLESESARWERLAFIRHLGNQGKGAAICGGIAVARGQLLLFADADGATPIREEAKLRNAIVAGADIAIGFRAPGHNPHCRRTPCRRMIAVLFMGLTRLLLGLRFADTQCGFKMFRSATCRRLFEEARESGFLLDIELLMRAMGAGFRVEQVCVNWSEMAGSKVRLFRDSARILVGMFALRRRLKRGKRRQLSHDATQRVSPPVKTLDVVGAVICGLLIGVRGASAASDRDAFDVSQGAQITAASATIEGAGADGLLGAATPSELNAGVTIFEEGGTNFVVFTTPGKVAVDGIELFVRSDDNMASGPRSVDRFSFYADADGDGEFERLLVDHVWPRNDGSPNSYAFDSVTAANFKAEFTSGWAKDDDRQGPRIIEIDARAAVPPLNSLWGIVGGAAAIATLLAVVVLRRSRK